MDGRDGTYREVGVIEDQRLLRPGPVETRPVRVRPPQGVSARESNDLPIYHAHAVEDITEVLVAFFGVRQTAVGGDLKGGREEGREGGREG